MSKQKLKKIVKELKGASKMHAGQAKKIDGILEKSTAFKLKDVNSPMKCWKTHKKVGMKDSPTYGASVQVNDCKKK